jgi:hypothetical protein
MRLKRFRSLKDWDVLQNSWEVADESRLKSVTEDGWEIVFSWLEKKRTKRKEMWTGDISGERWDTMVWSWQWHVSLHFDSKQWKSWDKSSKIRKKNLFLVQLKGNSGGKLHFSWEKSRGSHEAELCALSGVRTRQCHSNSVSRTDSSGDWIGLTSIERLSCDFCRIYGRLTQQNDRY